MFCSHCGSQLIAGSNQCLHCGRMESSVHVVAPDRPELEAERRRRRAPWLVGIPLVLINVALLVPLALIVSGWFVLPEPDSGPLRPVEPVTMGVVPTVDRAPAEAWTLPLAGLGGEGFDRPRFIYPGEYAEELANLAVAVSASDEQTYLRGIDLTSGGVQWTVTLDGRLACGFDRVDSLVCFSSTREVTMVHAADGAKSTSKLGTIEAPTDVWVATDGAVFVLSAADPGGEGIHDVHLALTRTDATGKPVWTQQATLPIHPGDRPQLYGAGPLVAVSTRGRDADGRPATPTMLRYAESGVTVPGLVDAHDVTLLPDGRFGVQEQPNKSKLYDPSGKELFPVAGRLVLPGGRDLPSDKIPTLALAYPAVDERDPQPPTLLAVEPSGGLRSLGQGVPALVCAGLLIVDDAVSAERTFSAQTLDGGSQVWANVHPGDRLDVACDGKYLLVLTQEDGRPVVRVRSLKTGDAEWAPGFADRRYDSRVPGHGWFLYNPKDDALVLVRP